MVRLSALKNIGYYDERLRLYYTEDDICIRLRQAGWRLHYVRDFVFFHAGAQSTGKRPLTVTAVIASDRLRFVAKHMGDGAAMLLAPVLAFDLAWRWFLILRRRARVRFGVRADGGR